MPMSLTVWTAGGHMLTGYPHEDHRYAAEEQQQLLEQKLRQDFGHVTITPSGESPIKVQIRSIVAWQITGAAESS